MAVKIGNAGTRACRDDSIPITLVHCRPRNAVLVCQNRNNLRSQKGQMAIPAPGRTSVLRRRSTRIPLNSSVAISGEDRSKCSFTVGAKATGLNKHGGAIQIAREWGIPLIGS
jgi:hypothetical protein